MVQMKDLSKMLMQSFHLQTFSPGFHPSSAVCPTLLMNVALVVHSQKERPVEATQAGKSNYF